MKPTTILKSQAKHLLKKSYYNRLITSYRNEALLEKDAIFIHIPKCAGTAVLHSLFNQQAGLGHKKAVEYLEIYGILKFTSAYKFTIVRNPYERFISAYSYLISGGNNSHDLLFMKEHLIPSKNINDFIQLDFRRNKDIQRHKHFQPQYCFTHIDNQLSVDFVGRMENIEKDFTFISNILGIDNNLKKTNKSKNMIDFKLNNDSLDILGEFYEKDFTSYRYER